MARRKAFKGISSRHRVNVPGRRDDVRSFADKLAEWTSTGGGTINVFGLLTGLSMLLVWAPFLPELVFLLALTLFLRRYRFKGRRWNLPLRVPAYLGSWKREPVHDATTSEPGRGNLYLGKDLETDEEVWAEMGDVNKHVLITGTTGAGKTEAQIAQMLGFLANGSGTMLVDGKASDDTIDAMRAIHRLLGRDDDFLQMEYRTGGRDIIGAQGEKRSHSYNPLAFGASAQKSEVMVSLLSDSKDVWSDRAILFLEAVIPPLSYLSERGLVILNPSLLSEYLNLEVLENLVLFGVIVDRTGETMHLPSAQPGVWSELDSRLESLKLYVNELPGFSLCRPKGPNRTPRMMPEAHDAMRVAVQSAMSPHTAQMEEAREVDKQARRTTTDQHGYITMQLVRSISSLATSYGYIYNARLGEISFQDVVLNRRSLLVLLPALERSPANLEMLGKMTLLSLKTVLGTLLNTRSEGTRREIIEGSPSKSEVPWMAGLDEVGNYIVPGLSVVPAQARSLGVSVYFGTQDVSSLMKANEAEGKAILDNTALKFFGKLTSPKTSDTAQTAMGMGGDAKTQVASEMTLHRGFVPGFDDRLKLSPQSTLQEDSVIHYDDLVEQEKGEFHLVVGAKEIRDDTSRGGARVVRMLSFYAGVGALPRVQRFRLNPFVEVHALTDRRAEALREAERAERGLRRGLAAALTDPSDDLVVAVDAAARSVVGRFVAWRERRIADGTWLTARSDRARLVREWVAAEDRRRAALLSLARIAAEARTIHRRIKTEEELLGRDGVGMALAMVEAWLDARRRRAAAVLDDEDGALLLKIDERAPAALPGAGPEPLPKEDAEAMGALARRAHDEVLEGDVSARR